MGRRGLSNEYAAIEYEVVLAFQEGYSMAILAKHFQITVQSVERLIRNNMLAPDRTRTP